MTRVLAILVAVSAAALLDGGPGVAAQKRLAWQGNVDRLFAAWDRKDSPGCAVAIYRDGRILYERGYGMADLEHDVPITPATVFYAGSVSKQFTAFAAALAIQAGHLGLDDPIRRYLPELPAYADAITVRHLIHHTSGLRDFYTLLSIAGRRQDVLFDNASILRLAARQKELNFPPGEDYLYSNTGYALLAIIVGRAAKTSFGELTRSQIFAPLGMSASEFGDDAGRLVKARAWGYTWGPKGEARLDTPGGERVGAGGLFTTVRDLLRWDENFYTGKVGGKPLIARIESPGALDGGKPLTYAWGLQVARYRGLRVIEHSGALGGYRAHLSRFPDQHVSVALLCNLATITPGTLVQRIADLVLADRLSAPNPGTAAGADAPRAAQATDSAQRDGSSMGSLESAAGVYVSDEIDAVFRLISRDGRLLLQREDDAEPQSLQAAGNGTFRFRTMTIRFERSSDGRVGALVVDAGRVRNIRFERSRP